MSRGSTPRPGLAIFLLLVVAVMLLSSCVSPPSPRQLETVEWEDPCEGLPPLYGTDC